MKVCNKCAIDKPLSEYAKLGKGKSSPDGHTATCKSCLNKKGKAWRESKSKVYHRMYRYGLSEDAYHALLEVQNYSCALCDSKDPKRKQGFVVDHDHITGRIRGLLCHPCNIALGMLGDNKEGLLRALNYIMRHND